MKIAEITFILDGGRVYTDFVPTKSEKKIAKYIGKGMKRKEWIMGLMRMMTSAVVGIEVELHSVH